MLLSRRRTLWPAARHLFNPATYGLQGWWLNDTTGGGAAITADAYDSLTLTNNGSVTSTNGPSTGTGEAGSFNGTNQYLSIVSSAAVQTGNTDFLAGVAFKTNSANAMGLFSKSTAAGSGDFQLFVRAANHTLEGIVYNGASTVGLVNPATVINDNVWHLALFAQDVANNRVGISIDGGAFAFATRTGTPAVGTSPLCIGADSDPTSFFSGSIYGAFLCKPPNPIASLLVSAPSLFWNGGNFRKFPF